MKAFTAILLPILAFLLISQPAQSQLVSKKFRIGYLAAANAKAYKPRTDALIYGAH